MARPEGRAARAVREALDTFAAGPVRDEILRRALEAAGLEEVPDSGPELRSFMDGPLRHAVISLFDDHTAEALSGALAPILERAELEESGVHDRADAAPPTGEAHKALFCVDLSRDDAERARRYAGSAAHLWCIDDHLLLREAISGSLEQEPCLLVDTRHVRPRAGRIGALARQLPPGARVVLWGASEADTQLLGAGHRELEWLHVGERASLREVVAVCVVPSVSGSRRRPVLVERPVLVVEHDAARRRALSELVTSLGYAVAGASTGAEALALCARRMPLALVVDQLLPGMGGTEVARLLRNTAGDETPPVVLLVRDVLDASDAAAITAAVPASVAEEKLGALLHRIVPRDDEPAAGVDG